MRSCLTLLSFVLLFASAADAHPHPELGEGGSFFERFIPHQGRLGVQLQDMTPELREFLRAPKERGVLVVRVNAGSAAAKAGVRVGDVIVAIGGEPVAATPEVVHAVMSAQTDAKLALEIVRDGKTRALEATLAGEPPALAGPLRWMDERMPEIREGLERRLHELEQRVHELEQRLRDAAPASDELDT